MPLKKPNTFQLEITPLDGSEELYTQTSGINNKFKVQDIWDSTPFSQASSGDTIDNYSIIDINNQQTVVNSINTGSTVLITGGTVLSGDTMIIYDLQDGTYTIVEPTMPDVTISPANYKTGTVITGEKWVDGNFILRQVFVLPVWTIGTEGLLGFISLSSIPNMVAVTRLNAFCKYTYNGSDYVNNIQCGDGTAWGAGLFLTYNTTTSLYELYWKELLDDSFIINRQPEVYFILEYAKP